MKDIKFISSVEKIKVIEHEKERILSPTASGSILLRKAKINIIHLYAILYDYPYKSIL